MRFPPRFDPETVGHSGSLCVQPGELSEGCVYASAKLNRGDPWYSPRMRSARGVVVLGLGLAGVAPALAQSTPRAPTREGALRVLTYNVHGLPAPITGDDTLARQDAIGPRLKPFDVVGIQEDFMPDGHARLMRGVTQPTRQRFQAALSGRVYGSGLTLLARPRVVARHSNHYTTFHGLFRHGSDGMASKGFQMLRLRLAGGVEVDVYNSHMDAGGARGDQVARATQVAQITSAMQTVSAGRAVVFLGDTNLESRRGQDVKTLGRWLRTTRLACACRPTRKTCCGRIDRILYRSGAGVRLSVKRWGVAPGFVDAKRRPLSDHAPIQAVLRWRRRPL